MGTKSIQELSFKKGFSFLNDHEKIEVRRDIMEGLNITTLQGFGRRMRGVLSNVKDSSIIESAFAKHKIKPKDIWGN